MYSLEKLDEYLEAKFHNSLILFDGAIYNFAIFVAGYRIRILSFLRTDLTR